ncbi:methyl-accepting chemotaxis protein, partial [Enterobacter sp. 63]
VTQQNASLVEQVSAAASALERQTEDLQRSVQKFRLSAQEPQTQAVATPLKTPARAKPAATPDDWVSF